MAWLVGRVAQGEQDLRDETVVACSFACVYHVWHRGNNGSGSDEHGRQIIEERVWKLVECMGEIRPIPSHPGSVLMSASFYIGRSCVCKFILFSCEVIELL